MSNIKIETLSPVHIGSGNMLQNNTDFIVTKEDGDRFIHIIEERKILELIGEEHLDNWLLSIEKKEPTLDLIKRFAPSSKIEDFSKQRITCYASNVKPSDTLKEIMHNGTGLPYIPGSSIKGAIRTAIVASLINKNDKTEIAEKIIQTRRTKDGEIPRTDRFGNKMVFADNIEKDLFGRDPNSDVFRFIRVGDAYFEEDCVIATRMINLNITHQNDLWDESKSQFVQALGPGERSSFQMNVAQDYYLWAKSKFPALGDMPNELQSIPNLFMMINAHTEKLVKEEIAFWKDIDKTGADLYVEIMEDMLKSIEICGNNGTSCVLRIGHASGWRFITGAWTENLPNFEIDVVNAARPNNRKYEEYDFPKTRRVDQDSDILGFVKLTIEE